MQKDTKELIQLQLRTFLMKAVGLVVSDEQINRVFYRIKLKKNPDFDNPETFSEKLQVLKMYYDNPLVSMCVDKYYAGQYVEKCGHGDILKKIYAVYNDPDEIKADELPEKCFLQMSHMSKFNYIVNGRDAKQIAHIKKIFRRLMKYNHYDLLREKPYKMLSPRIICCELLEEPKHKNLTDYKFYCFDGEVKYFMISFGEYEHNVRNAKFDINWNNLDKEFKGKQVVNVTCEDAPANFDEMIKIAQDLSKGFPHVRVDLYNISGRIVFGELTFFSSGGFVHVKSEEMDRKIGSWVDLKKYRNDLTKKFG